MQEAAGGRRGTGEIAVRRGCAALLALLLALVSAGLGPGAPRPATASPAHAGAGASDSREPVLLRPSQRPAILTHRAGDRLDATPPSDPALPAARAGIRFADAADAVRAGEPRHRPRHTGQPRPYQARAPPAAA